MINSVFYHSSGNGTTLVEASSARISSTNFTIDDLNRYVSIILNLSIIFNLETGHSGPKKIYIGPRHPYSFKALYDTVIGIDESSTESSSENSESEINNEDSGARNSTIGISNSKRSNQLIYR